MGNVWINVGVYLGKNNSLKNYFFRSSVLFNNVFKAVTWKGFHLYPANVYLFKVNNRNTRKRCEVRSKLTIKTPERRQ